MSTYAANVLQHHKMLQRAVPMETTDFGGSPPPPHVLLRYGGTKEMVLLVRSEQVLKSKVPFFKFQFLDAGNSNGKSEANSSGIRESGH